MPTVFTMVRFFSRRFGLLSMGTPLRSVSFGAYMNDLRNGDAGGTRTPAANAVASVQVVLKTSEVYSDSPTSEVAFQVHDEDGRVQVATSGLTVSLKLTLGNSSYSTECSAPDSTTGIGLCSASVDENGFSSTGVVTAKALVFAAYSSTTAATSEALSITLQLKPV